MHILIYSVTGILISRHRCCVSPRSCSSSMSLSFCGSCTDVAADATVAVARLRTALCLGGGYFYCISLCSENAHVIIARRAYKDSHSHTDSMHLATCWECYEFTRYYWRSARTTKYLRMSEPQHTTLHTDSLIATAPPLVRHHRIPFQVQFKHAIQKYKLKHYAKNNSIKMRTQFFFFVSLSMCKNVCTKHRRKNTYERTN